MPTSGVVIVGAWQRTVGFQMGKTRSGEEKKRKIVGRKRKKTRRWGWVESFANKHIVARSHRAIWTFAITRGAHLIVRIPEASRCADI